MNIQNTHIHLPNLRFQLSKHHRDPTVQRSQVKPYRTLSPQRLFKEKQRTMCVCLEVPKTHFSHYTRDWISNPTLRLYIYVKLTRRICTKKIRQFIQSHAKKKL